MKRISNGMGLPMILFACGLLAMATGVVGAYAISNMNSMSREQIYDQAHYGSYSGIQWALGAVSEDPRTSSANASQAVGLLEFASNRDLICKVYIYSNLASANTRCSEAPDGTIIPNNLIYVVADSQIKGQAPGASTRSAQLSALCTPKQYYFNHALLGLEAVQLLGTSKVDAYTGGSFLATTPSPLVAGEGSIATNDEVTAAAISLTSTSIVDGKAYVGRQGNAGTGIELNGGSVPTNCLAKDNLQENIPVKLDKVPSNPNQVFAGGLTVGAGQTIRFEGGKTYQVNGDLVLNANSQILVDPNPSNTQQGPQKDNAFVFVENNVIVNQGILGDKNLEAQRLQIFLPRKPGGHTFTMNQGSGSFLVCGPDLVADINNGSDIQGGVIAKTVRLSDSKIHFDTKLRDSPKGPMGWSVGGFNSDQHGNQGGGQFSQNALPQPPQPGPPQPGPPQPPSPPPQYTTPPYGGGSTYLP